MRTWKALVLMLVVWVYVAVLGMGRARAVVGPDLAFAECEVGIGSSTENAGDEPRGMERVVLHVPSAMVVMSRDDDQFLDLDDGFVVQRSNPMSDAVPRRRGRLVSMTAEEDGEYEDADGDLWLLSGADDEGQKPSGWGWLADSVRDSKRGRETSIFGSRRDVLDTRVLKQDVFTRARNATSKTRSRDTRDSVPSRRTDSAFESPAWGPVGAPPRQAYP